MQNVRPRGGWPGGGRRGDGSWTKRRGCKCKEETDAEGACWSVTHPCHSPSPHTQRTISSRSPAPSAAVTGDVQGLTWRHDHFHMVNLVILAYARSHPTAVGARVPLCQILHGHCEHSLGTIVPDGESVPPHRGLLLRGDDDDSGTGIKCSWSAPEFRLLLQASLVPAGHGEGLPQESPHCAGPRHRPAACGDRRRTGSAAAAPTPSTPPVGAAPPEPLRDSAAPARLYLAVGPRRAAVGAAWPLRDDGARRLAERDYGPRGPACHRDSPARPVGAERQDPRGAGEKRRSRGAVLDKLYCSRDGLGGLRGSAPSARAIGDGVERRRPRSRGPRMGLSHPAG